MALGGYAMIRLRTQMTPLPPRDYTFDWCGLVPGCLVKRS